MIKETSLNPTLTSPANVVFASRFLMSPPVPQTRWSPGSLAVSLIGRLADTPDPLGWWVIDSLIDFDDCPPDEPSLIVCHASAFSPAGVSLGDASLETGWGPAGGNAISSDHPSVVGGDGVLWPTLIRSDGFVFPVVHVQLATGVFEGNQGLLEFQLGDHEDLGHDVLPNGEWTLTIPANFAGALSLSPGGDFPSRSSSVSLVVPTLEWTIGSVLELAGESGSGVLALSTRAFRNISIPHRYPLQHNFGEIAPVGFTFVCLLDDGSDGFEIPLVSVSGGSGLPGGGANELYLGFDLSVFPNQALAPGVYTIAVSNGFTGSLPSYAGEPLPLHPFAFSFRYPFEP